MLAGYRAVFEEEPSSRTLAILVAQSALETGHWRSIWNFNMGNMRGVAREPGGWTSFRAGEMLDTDGDGDREEVIFEAGPKNKFRAYVKPEDSAEDMIRFVGTDSNNDGINIYAEAWEAALEGDPDRYARNLGPEAVGEDRAYYTTNEDRYARVLISCFDRYLSACEEVTLTGEELDARDGLLPSFHDCDPFDPSAVA